MSARKPLQLPLPLLYLVFAMSGFAALTYQVVWQRSLFAIYGVNIESVTVVVAAFMLGLGLGSFAGGKLSANPHRHLLRWFAGIEICIGALGVISLPVFTAVGAHTSGVSGPFVFGLTFALVVVPTMLMGATLPLLVAHAVKRSGNVGESVGALYFVNTLGSALASFCTAITLLRHFGQQGTVWIAAAVNVSAGLLVLAAARRREVSTAGESAAGVAAPKPVGETEPSSPFSIALMVAAVSGFLGLSYEIVWFRIYSFLTGGTASGFGVLLSMYLLGIALGSLASRRLCRERGGTGGRRMLVVPAALLAMTAVGGLLLAPGIATWVVSADWTWTLLWVVVLAGLNGAILPLLAHFGIAPDSRAGQRLSWLYLGNIVGSTGGSLLTGFVLLDALTLRQVSLLLAAIALVAAVALTLAAQVRRWQLAVSAATCLCMGLAMFATSEQLFSQLWERLQAKSSFTSAFRFKDVVENRHGVITVDTDETVYGGGVYDGHFSTSLTPDINGITRQYALAGWHKRPRNVLMIGLASGSWAQVIVHHPDLEKLTVVEIQPGYLSLIKDRQVVRSVLDNPKIELVIDDGRRWLAAHPDARFDAIIQNTSFWWRGHSTSLLSADYMRKVSQHLRPGGVFMFNVTAHEPSMRTACKSWQSGFRMANFMVVGNEPLRFNSQRFGEVLKRWRIDGKLPLRPGDPAHDARWQALVNLATDAPSPGSKVGDGRWLEPCAKIVERTKGQQIVTDDNLLPEFQLRWTYAPNR